MEILTLVATSAATCSLFGHGVFVTPESACTPGAYERLSRAQACVHKDRPTLPAADRRKVLAQYGVPDWTGKDGEIDHKVPFFLGGRTNVANLWPEPGAIPNPKDKLEFYVYRRVCFSEPMRMSVRTGRRIFLADWRIAYRKYIR